MDDIRVVIENFRLARGLSRYRFAREAGIDPGHYHRFCTGERGLGRRTLGRLIHRFPELTPYVLIFLHADSAHGDSTFASESSVDTEVTHAHRSSSSTTSVSDRRRLRSIAPIAGKEGG